MADRPHGGTPPKGGKGLNGLTRNPKTLAGLGAAAAVVVFALIKRKSGAAADAPGTTTAGTAKYDSTATDQYNGIANQLWALQQQIGSITQGTGGVAGGTGGTPTPKPKPKPKPGPKPKPKPKPPGVKPPKPNPPRASPFSTVTVSHGQTLSGIASSHGEKLSQLLKDNPVYTTNAKYKGGNRIWAGDKVKVR